MSLLLGAALYAALPLAQLFWPLMLISGCLGLTLGLGVPISLNLIYEAAPQGRSNEAVGLSQMLTNLQQTVLPLLLGVIAAGSGEAAMIWMISAIMLATAALVRV